MAGGKEGGGAFESGGQWPGACGGGHCGDLGLRGCAVGMCRRRLRSWQIPIKIVIMIIIIIIILIVIVTMMMVQSPAWLVDADNMPGSVSSRRFRIMAGQVRG